MNIRAIMVGTLAVVCGLSAIVLVQAMRKPPTGPAVDRVPVVFAAADIKPGEALQESMLEIREIRKDEAPEDAIHKAVDALERAAMTQIDKGDMLREKKLAEKGAGRGMAALIKTGMRAFTITTPSFSSSLAGFILPGNHVDVLLTVNSDEESGGTTTSTLLQDVEILAVHTTVNAPTANKIDPDLARSVTLLVKPEDASLLDLGQNKGTLHLSLRNLKDVGIIKPQPTRLADLHINLIKPKPVVEAPAPAPAPEPSPAFSLPQLPEMVEVRVRTLRGTAAGADVITFIRPAASTAKIARTLTGQTRPAGPSSRGAGPPP